LQVLEKEVTVDTSDPNELAVADGEDILERLVCGDWRRYASCFRYEGGLVVTIEVSLGDAMTRYAPTY
jgi:hypothetical protein